MLIDVFALLRELERDPVDEVPQVELEQGKEHERETAAESNVLRIEELLIVDRDLWLSDHSVVDSIHTRSDRQHQDSVCVLERHGHGVSKLLHINSHMSSICFIDPVLRVVGGYHHDFSVLPGSLAFSFLLSWFIC